MNDIKGQRIYCASIFYGSFVVCLFFLWSLELWHTDSWKVQKDCSGQWMNSLVARSVFDRNEVHSWL